MAMKSFKVLKSRPRIGLALGAGAARGWAHVGVIKALEEAGIPIDVVAGTSAGAIIGAFYAADALDRLYEFSEKFTSIYHNLMIMDFALHPQGLLEGKRFVRTLAQYLPERYFENLRIPLGVAAANISDMQEVHITAGALLPAIRASIAVPGFMKPLEYEGQYLVDGAVLNPVPVNLVRNLGADVVIAVDICDFPANRCQNAWEVMNRSVETMMHRIRMLNRHLEKPDVVIEPDMKGLGFFDNHRSQESIEAGYNAARAALPEIRKSIHISLWQRMFSGTRQFITSASLDRLLQKINSSRASKSTSAKTL